MKRNKLRVKLVYYRAMMSQSAASLTMGRIASLLKRDNFLYDLVLLESDDINTIERIGLDGSVIIAKPNFKDYDIILPLLKKIKQKCSDMQIFLCGPYISLDYKNIILKENWLDGIIVGFPEEPSHNLVKAISQGKSIDDIDNVVTLKNIEQFKISSNRIDFEDLPTPTRDIERFEAGSFTNIEASRGCDNFCSYCHIPLYSRQCNLTKRELRSNESIVDEIEELRAMGKNFLIFNDSHFWSNDCDNERVINFCDILIKRKLSIHFYIYLRSFPFPNEEVLLKLRDAGLARVFIGVENATVENQKRYNKIVNLDQFDQVKSRCENMGINVHIGFMLFNPYLAFSEIKPNLDYLLKINKMFRLGVITEPARVIPGSKLEKDLERDGLLFRAESYNAPVFEYKFKDEKTAILFREIRQLFIGEIYLHRYRFEYYAITGQLFRDLTELSYSGISNTFNKEYEQFLLSRDYGSRLIYDFLISQIDEIDINGKISLDNKNVFKDKFIEACADIELKWTMLKNSISKTAAKDVIKEVYFGKERIS